MKHDYKVSVILPTFNQENYIEKAINSVLNQTFSNWELIIINNNSQDRTIELVNAFKDDRIILFNFSNDGIIAKSRNYGVAKSSGNIIAFLDSDDTWKPKKLDTCVAELIKNNADLVCHGETWDFNGKKNVNVFYNANVKNITKTLLFRGNRLSTSAVVVKKKAFNYVSGFSEELEIVTSEDYDLWIRLSVKKQHFYFINEILGTCLIHDGGNSRNIIKARIATYNVFRKYVKSFTTYHNFWSVVRFTHLTISAIKEYLLQKIY